jgi:hypothetical protein
MPSMSDSSALANELTFGSSVRGSEVYGADYLSELDRLIRLFVPREHGAVLEWGIGNSTLFLLDNHARYGVRRLVSIDHDRAYFDAVLAQLPHWPGFHPLCCDLMGPKLSDRDPEPNYATVPLTLGHRFDLIYIDGRRRLECALVAVQLCNPAGVVLMHDYRRRRYDSVRVLYDVLEEGSQFRVMRPKVFPPA